MGREGKGVGRAYKKGRRVGGEIKVRGPARKNAFKDYQASDLRIPLGWVLEAQLHLNQSWKGVLGVSRSGPLGRQAPQTFLLRPEELLGEGSSCQWEAWRMPARPRWVYTLI